jgi:dipeptidyl aminopeptidase/acylaminoacyl peptidase
MLNPRTSQSRTRRRLRLTAFALLCFFVFYISINTSLAFIYAYFLTHPGCIESPLPISGIPSPEERWLDTSDGLKIRSWYYPPRNEVVIMTFGGQRGALGQNLPPVTALIQSGYGVLQMDSRACAKPPSVVTLGADEINDANAGVDFLLSQPEVKRIGAFGFSMGAATVIRTAAKNSDIEAIIAEGGFYNLGDDIVEPDQGKFLPLSIFLYTIAGSYWLFSGGNPWQVSPIDDLPRISPRPVLLIYGEKEVESGRAQAQYAAANQPKTIWIVPKGDHGTNHLLHPVIYERNVVQFFNQSLLK